MVKGTHLAKRPFGQGELFGQKPNTALLSSVNQVYMKLLYVQVLNTSECDNNGKQIPCCRHAMLSICCFDALVHLMSCSGSNAGCNLATVPFRYLLMFDLKLLLTYMKLLLICN